MPFHRIALWEFQGRHSGALPFEDNSNELGEIADGLFLAAKINKRVLQTMPKDIIQYVFSL